MSDSNGHNRSLSELERDAERTRAELMMTVDALRQRVSPGALKEDAKDYIRHTGEGILGGIQQRARENPLQAVAIAAGLAFPIWRMATSIPVPLMLIGAGLALGRASSTTPGETYGSELYQQARDKAEETAGAVRTGLHDAKDALQQKLSSVAETVSTTAGQVSDQVSARLSSAREQAGSALDTASAAAGSLAARAAALPGQVYGSGAETAQGGMQRMQSGAEQVRDTTLRSAEQARDAAARGAADMRARGERLQHDLLATMERNPVLVGLLGLAAGAVVAAAFPSTRVENRMFGETSDAMKTRAQELASEGAQFARTTAGDLYDQALEEARAQGLSPDALRDAVRELADRAKTTAQNATGRTAQPDLSTTH